MSKSVGLKMQQQWHGNNQSGGSETNKSTNLQVGFP